jgi:hypothetical protein
MDHRSEIADILRIEAMEAQQNSHTAQGQKLPFGSTVTLAGLWILLATIVTGLLFVIRIPVTDSFEVLYATPDIDAAAPYAYQIRVVATSANRIAPPAEILSTCGVLYACVHRTPISSISYISRPSGEHFLNVAVVLTGPVQLSRVFAFAVSSGDVSLADLIRRRIKPVGAPRQTSQ